MKIAQVAPLFERVPPELYGGTEGVVSYLTEALIDLGHGLTLFASGDSITRARLIPGSKSALRLRGNAVKDSIALHVAMLGQLLKNVEEYDLIHFHIDYLHLPFLQQLPVSFLTTMHGRLDISELQAVFRQFHLHRWFPFQIHNANLWHGRIGSARCIMVFRKRILPSVRSRKIILRFWVGFVRRKAWLVRSRSLVEGAYRSK